MPPKLHEPDMQPQHLAMLIPLRCVPSLEGVRIFSRTPRWSACTELISIGNCSTDLSKHDTHKQNHGHQHQHMQMQKQKRNTSTIICNRMPP